MSDTVVEPGQPIPAEYQPEPAAPAEPAEPAWAGPSQEEWQQVTGALSALAENYQRQQQVWQPPAPDQPSHQFDPFAEDPASQIRAIIQAELAPYQQFQQDIVYGEADERAMDILRDIGVRDGEFNTDMARMRADQLIYQFGNDPQAAEKALEQAAREQREWEQSFRQQAVQRYQNEIATLSGAPGEPGSTYTQGVQQRTMPDYTKGGSVTGRFFGQNREVQ